MNWHARLGPDGRLTCGRQGPAEYQDDVPLDEPMTGLGPFAYDAVRRRAVPHLPLIAQRIREERVRAAVHAQERVDALTKLAAAGAPVAAELAAAQARLTAAVNAFSIP